MTVSIGGPIFLIAVGAILRYATNFDISGIDMDVVGLILMIAGIAALLLSLGVALYNSADRNRGSGGGRPPTGGAPPPPPRR
jgi:hypothetical protein